MHVAAVTTCYMNISVVHRDYWWFIIELSSTLYYCDTTSVTCVFVSSCLETKVLVLISKYLATRRVMVPVGGMNGSERQLLYKC